MPRIVNYSDRADAVGEAVCRLVLELGTSALDVEHVADRLHWSASTVRRTINRVDLLPLLGLRWLDRERRLRYFATMRRVNKMEDHWDKLVTLVESEMPLDEDRILEEHVWAQLVGLARGEEAASMALDRRELIGSYAEALADLSAPQTQRPQHSAALLRVLVSGLHAGAASGWLDHETADALWRDHLATLRPSGDRPADALAPHVNDR